ncbi:uncharacterized protein LOC111641660 isoform X1 [Centruroides sculpturatus]|uniref:uncharacterized protein LOC111641660 isoform X1 n=1 Tax=Centruroides sculpturatus TaxID=218467 RepID=UPI000C6D933F|nr:uncharacterized protein LOC111641660 isoform X1 [Centruroides sculpturatus]
MKRTLMLSIKNLENFIQEITVPNEQMVDDELKSKDFSDSEYNMEHFVSFLELNSSVMNSDYVNYNNDNGEVLKISEMKSSDNLNFSYVHNENKILKISNKRISDTPVFKNGINYTTSRTDLKIKGDSQINTIYDENVSLSDDNFNGVSKIVKKTNNSEKSEKITNCKKSVLKKSDFISSANNSEFKHLHTKSYQKKSTVKPYKHIKENHKAEETKHTFKIRSFCKKNNFHQSKINDEKENMKNNYEEIKLSNIIIESVLENKSLIQKTENNTSTISTVSGSNYEDPIVIDSDSNNDELLVLPTDLIETSVDDKSNKVIPEVDIRNHTISGNLSKCTLNLDRIIDAKNKTMKEEELIYNLSKEEINDNKFEDTDLKQLIKNINIKEIQKDRITDFPPGLEIFDYKKCYRYFCVFHGLNLESCGFQANKGSTFDKKIAKLSSTELKELITFGVFQCQLSSMKCKEAFLEYCFKLLSVLNNNLLSFACTDIFWYYIKTSKNGHIYWCPSMKDILTVILNYGVNVDRCPIINKYNDCEKMLMKFENSCLLEKEDVTSCWNEEIFSIEDGLFKVLDVLIVFLHYKCNYSKEELCDLILLLSWISLDTKFIGKQIKIKIKELIDICLERISSSDWPDKMKFLTEELAQLGSHHRNTLYVVQLLPTSNRGVSLQKAVSFLAIQYLLELEDSYFVADVTVCIY